MAHGSIPAEVACAIVEDGAVLLHMGTKRYFSLNETGAAIWRLVEDGVTIEEIPARLHERYDVALAEAERTVTELVAVLVEKELLTVAE
jgi:coenzyme PQQ synthesis protein D (PqqD)